VEEGPRPRANWGGSRDKEKGTKRGEYQLKLNRFRFNGLKWNGGGNLRCNRTEVNRDTRGKDRLVGRNIEISV